MRIQQISHWKNEVRFDHYLGHSLLGLLSSLAVFLSEQGRASAAGIAEAVHSQTKMVLPTIQAMEKLYTYLHGAEPKNEDLRTSSCDLSSHLAMLRGKTNVVDLLGMLVQLWRSQMERPCELLTAMADHAVLSKVDMALHLLQDIHELQKSEPDIGILFGRYLVYKGLLQPHQLEKAVQIQQTLNQPFGQVAVSHGFLLQEHIQKLLKIQTKIKKKIGELALQNGLMQTAQVDTVLEFQKAHFVPLQKILQLENMVSISTLHLENHGFQLLLRADEADNGQLLPSPQQSETAIKNMLQSLVQTYPDVSSICWRADIIEFADMFTVAYENHLTLPAPLWGEMLEKRIFFAGNENKDWQAAIRNSRHMQSKIAGESTAGIEYQWKMIAGLVQKNMLVSETLARTDLAHTQVNILRHQVLQQSLQIVVVDDEPLFGKTVENMLATAGHRVTCFTSPKEILAELPHLNPQIILVDYYMPEMNGIELLKILRHRKPHIPVMLITGSPSTQITVTALKFGAADCIDKPISRKTLLEKIREACRSDSHVSANRWSCRGTLEATPFLELLQICCAPQHSGVLAIQSEGKHMSVYFENGRIVDAENDRFHGFKALLRMSLMKQGSFEFTASEVVYCQYTVTMEPTILIIELARQSDEFLRLQKSVPDFQQKLFAPPDAAANSSWLSSLLRQSPLSIQEILDNSDRSDCDILQEIVHHLEQGWLSRQPAQM